MKKQILCSFSLLLIAVFLLTGCSSKTDTQIDANTEQIVQITEAITETTTAQVGATMEKVLQTTEATDRTTEENPDDPIMRIPLNEETSADSPDWYTECFYTDSLENFLAWVYSGGTNMVDRQTGLSYGEYEVNQAFLNWVNKHREIMLPIVNDISFNVYMVRLGSFSPVLVINGNNKTETSAHEEVTNFGITISPIEWSNGNVQYFCKKTYNMDIPEEQLVKGDSPYGECWYRLGDNEEKQTAFFEISGYFISIGFYNFEGTLAWNNANFEIFAFDTVKWK